MRQETVQVNNHYEVLLPLKSTDVIFPSNNKEVKLEGSSFHGMYKTSVYDMSHKVYARKSENEQVEKVCYITYYGVTHSEKS